jgi:cephalosporin hydroxylase
MISTYRLGDLVLLDLGINEINEILRDHPDSIGSKFILKKRSESTSNNIDIITKIVLEEITKNQIFLPKDISDSTLIHLRLGDVVAGNAGHEIIKRPLQIDYIQSLLKNDINKKYVIGKCFFAKTSSSNYDECMKLSETYLQNVIREIQAEHFNSNNADIDLCCAIKSKVFVQGRGYFSKLIIEIRKKLNLTNIETMRLEELVDNSRTDKNTTHSYLPLYQNLLISKKNTAKNVLEIGIGYGGSIKMWSDFFPNANVYGLDIMDIKNVWRDIKNKDNIILYTSTDAYNKDFFINNLLNKDIKFDFMLDDGPHSLESMIKFIKLYSQLMAHDGILVIEDVQSLDWVDILKDIVPENLKQFIKIYDLRNNKNRYDDIVFTIDKSNP